MTRGRSYYGGPSKLRAVFALAASASVFFAIFMLEVPSRIAELGSGNLDRIVAPTTTAAFGEPVRLTGRNGAWPLIEVVAGAPQPTKVIGSHQARPPQGHRFVAVSFSIGNRGETPWHSSSGELVVLDAAETVMRPDQRVRRVRGARVLPGQLIVRPGKTRRGVAVFAVPRAAELSTVRFTVGSGLRRIAEWVPAESR